MGCFFMYYKEWSHLGELIKSPCTKLIMSTGMANVANSTFYSKEYAIVISDQYFFVLVFFIFSFEWLDRKWALFGVTRDI